MNVLTWRKVRTFAGVLYRKHPWALVLSGLLLAGSIAFALYYWHRSSVYEDVIVGTLSAEMMPTPQQRKGLEAFLMSGFPTGMEAALSSSTLSDAFIAELREIRDGAASAAQAPAGGPTLRLFKGSGGTVFTDQQPQGFLFLPSQVMRATLSPTQVNDLAAVGDGPLPPFLSDALKKDPELVRDIQFTAALVKPMDKLARMSVDGSPDHIPIQAYVITKNGLNRIFNGEEGPRADYDFPENTFFPSRPYFWPTFEQQKYSETLDGLVPPAGARVQNYFAISKPYMDLGGAGLVVTLTRGLWAEGFPRSVFCFDVRLEPTGASSLESLLHARIRKLGGHSVSMQCNTAGKDIPCTTSGAEDANTISLVRDMRHTLLTEPGKQRRAEILGNIYVFESPQKEGKLKGSVPLGPIAIGSAEARFVVFDLDLMRYRRLTMVTGFGAATLFGLMTFVLAVLWGAETKHEEELEEAFASVASVMHHSPTPYVRLGADDVIRDRSMTFLDLIKMTEPELARKKTFRSLLANEEERSKYDQVQKARRAGEPADPYHLRLARGDSTVVLVKIYSANVPSGVEGTVPETFGILVEIDEKLHPFEPRKPDQTSPKSSRSGTK